MATATTLLKKYGLRKTPFRLKVLDAFLSIPHAALNNLTLEEKLGEHDRITLYRTLKSFEEKDLIHQVVDGSNEMKYALCHDDCKIHVANKEHAHFYCTRCEMTFCLDNAGTVDIKLPDNYSLTKIDLALKGVCASCS